MRLLTYFDLQLYLVMIFFQTVDLYFREEDMDLETVLQLFFSFIFTVVILGALVLVCVPGMGDKRHFLVSGFKKVTLFAIIMFM